MYIKSIYEQLFLTTGVKRIMNFLNQNRIKATFLAIAIILGNTHQAFSSEILDISFANSASATGGAHVLAISPSDEILLMEVDYLKDDSTEEGIALTPGGRINKLNDPTSRIQIAAQLPRETAVKGLREKVGIDFDYAKLIQVATVSRTDIDAHHNNDTDNFFIARLAQKNASIQQPGRGIVDLHWVSITDIVSQYTSSTDKVVHFVKPTGESLIVDNIVVLVLEKMLSGRVGNEFLALPDYDQKPDHMMHIDLF